MDRRPIGVFDSGVGGLTALGELAALLPHEELIYFGDTGRVPYGGRSRETIIRYARQDVAFLRRFDPKAIVIACGTVSTTALEVLRAENDLPVFGVVEPACAAAVRESGTGRIGLIGTKASIGSGVYERTLSALRPGVRVTARACPLFVPLAENGRCRRGDRVAELVAEEYLAPLKDAGVDALILGCTHYPLLREIIGDCMGPDVALIDVGARCARHVADTLAEANALSGREGPGERRWFVSDDAASFTDMASLFLGENVSGHVEEIDVTSISI